jgi:type I restriction enzyme S subunit
MGNVILKRLGDLINLKRGYDLPESQRQPGHYPVISSAGISGYHNEYKVDGIGVVTGRYGTLGKMYFVEGKYWPHNTALYVTTFKGNEPKYIYYLLSCLGRIRTSDKSAVPGVNRNELHEMAVPAIDDKKQQKKIAAVLSALDAKTACNNSINAELEEMAKTLYDYWFVQFDFPDANGKPYRASGGKMTYNPTLKREIPAGWSQCDLSKIISRSATGLNPRDNFKLGHGENYYVTIKNVSNGKIVLDDKCDRIDEEALNNIDRRSLLQVGDVLFTSIAPVGVTYFIQEKPTNWNINESIFTIRPNFNKITSEYLFLLLSSSEMKTFTKNSSTGSIHKGIRHGVLKSFKLPYGNKKLIDEFSIVVKPILRRIDILDKENQHLTQLHDWLLPMLMNGQVTVA